MNKRLNKKGFTLVELLAVLVILIAIMGIALPTISSSLERTKEKQNKARYRIIESAAEQYVTDHKNAVYNRLDSNKKCYIPVYKLSDYLTDEEMKDANDEELGNYYVTFTWANNFVFNVDSSKGGATNNCVE